MRMNVNITEIGIVTLIINVTIPVSVMFTFILMYFQRLSLNVMTLSGLALGIGMLVDNSIVVLDNVDKKRAGLLPLPGWREKDRGAVIEGASEMGLAIA